MEVLLAEGVEFQAVYSIGLILKKTNHNLLCMVFLYKQLGSCGSFFFFLFFSPSKKPILIESPELEGREVTG